MKKKPEEPILKSIHLLNAVFCAECEFISESRHHVCAVCGSPSLVHLGRMLGSALKHEPTPVVDVHDPAITRSLRDLVDSADPENPVPASL